MFKSSIYEFVIKNLRVHRSPECRPSFPSFRNIDPRAERCSRPRRSCGSVGAKPKRSDTIQGNRPSSFDSWSRFRSPVLKIEYFFKIDFLKWSFCSFLNCLEHIFMSACSLKLSRRGHFRLFIKLTFQVIGDVKICTRWYPDVFFYWHLFHFL